MILEVNYIIKNYFDIKERNVCYKAGLLKTL